MAIVTPRILSALTPDEFGARAPAPIPRDVQPRVDAYLEEMRTGVYQAPEAPRPKAGAKPRKRPKLYRIW